jgi:hypothetical protein
MCVRIRAIAAFEPCLWHHAVDLDVGHFTLIMSIAVRTPPMPSGIIQFPVAERAEKSDPEKKIQAGVGECWWEAICRTASDQQRKIGEF